VLVVTKEQRVVASVMSFYFRDEILPYYGGGTEEARNLKANDFMYWEVMKLACERGSSIFDYGRSKEGTGSYHFKKNWGFKPEPLTYQYCLVNSKDLPNVSPTNKKYNTLIKIWQGLPLPIANCLGPFISRSLA
jgi:FemAB-related protein (PEP-CTERM system-associated)